MSARARFSIVLIGALLVLLGFSVFRAYQEISRMSVVDQLAAGLWFRAWMPHVFNHLSLAVAVSAVITCSLLVSPYDIGGTGRLIPAVRSILVIIVGVGIVNGVWFAAIGPTVEFRLDQIQDQNWVATTSRRQAEDLESLERFEEALAALRLYRAVVGSSQELDNEIEKLAVRAGQQRRRAREAADRGGETTFARAFEVEGLSVPELLERAEQALDAGNFYTAHYYAGVAADQSRFRREDARELQAQALNAIEDGIRRREERADRSFFQDKLQAYQLMQRGETDPRALVEAYYRFQELRRRAPDDPDVRRYAEEVQERLREISFFVDEAVEALAFPARRNVVFRNDRSGAFTELISAGRIIDAPHGTYLYDVEVVRLGENEAHLSAPYGKRIGDMLVLRALARNRDTGDGGVAEYVVAPRYLEGESDGHQLGEVIPLQPDVDQLLLVAGGVETLDTLSLVGLMRAPAAYDATGHAVAPVHAELIYRIVRIVGFFVAAFYSISIGWRFRSLYIGRPPLLVLLLVPLLPFATRWIMVLVRSVADAVLRAVTISGGATHTAIVTTGIMVAVLILAIASVARQTIEP
ncbi:MAG: hypothetical protein ACOCYB_02700 [Alkalispirochaeta sp.]